MQQDERTDDDEAARHWLEVLRGGTARQKARARTEIGLILERRGLLDEAIDAYRANVEARVADPRPYERLAALYRQAGDEAAEADVLLQMQAVFSPELTTSLAPEADDAGDDASTRAGRRRLGPLAIAMLGLAVIGILLLLGSVFLDLGRLGGGSPLGSVLPPPARCSDAAIRFPGADAPEAALRAAYAQNGASLDQTNPAQAGFIAAAAPKIVAGWIAMSLLLERQGRSAPTLAEWVGQDPEGVTLANLQISGRTLDTLITDAEWAEIQSWPPTSCEGAFVRNPRNVELVRLMATVVGD